MPKIWIYTQALLVLFIVIGMVIAIVPALRRQAMPHMRFRGRISDVLVLRREPWIGWPLPMARMQQSDR